MATPIKVTPKLSDSQWKKFTHELESKKQKVSASKKAEMRALLDKVLSNKK
jgi:hypothetical protein